MMFIPSESRSGFVEIDRKAGVVCLLAAFTVASLLTFGDALVVAAAAAASAATYARGRSTPRTTDVAQV